MTAVLPDDMPPPLAATERTFQRVLSAALASLGFFLLWSTAGISLSLAVLLGLCLAAPRRIWRLEPWREPVVAIGLVLWAYIALRNLAGGIDKAAFGAINQYHELLMVPLLWALMRLARRPQAFVNGLMAGALLFAGLHWLAPFSSQLEWFLQTRRISGGLGLAVCAFLFLEHARLGRLPAWFGYGGAVLLAVTVLFASGGRTGHLVLLLLAGCAAFRAAPRRWRIPAVVAALVIGLLAAAASRPVQQRLTETWEEAQPLVQGLQDTGKPGGPRVELLRSGLGVAQRHWLVGTGWVHYPEEFGRVSAERLRSVDGVVGAVSTNPHNEYLMQLGSGGAPALLLYLLWLGWPMWRALRENRPSHPWAGAVGCVALAFAASSMFNSVLLDFVEGHFYGALLAWLLVRRVRD